VSPGAGLTLAAFVLAVTLTILAERASHRNLRLERWLAIAAMVGCLLICAGIAAMLGEHFFNWPERVTVAVSLPAGVLLFALLVALGR
jgi:hypothetical protein